jgi:CBS domain-containing protein
MKRHLLLPSIAYHSQPNSAFMRVGNIDPDQCSKLWHRAADAAIICHRTVGSTAMKVADVMTRGVISITPESSVTKAARMMLLYDISGLPVIDSSGRLVGIVTEGDFLRRAEIGTEPHRKRWVALLVDIGPLAEEYAHSHGRKVEEVMTRDVVTVTEDASLEEVARLMERHRIKRVPVLRDAEVIGVVSRANFLHALIVLSPNPAPAPASDGAIREQILAELEKQAWMPGVVLNVSVKVNVSVKDGIVDLDGVILDKRQRAALCIAVENVPGVKQIRDRLVLSQVRFRNQGAQQQRRRTVPLARTSPTEPAASTGGYHAEELGTDSTAT